MGTVVKSGADPPAEDASGACSVEFCGSAEADTRNVQETAFYHMLVDASEAGENLLFNPRPVFRPDDDHPMADALDVDRELVDRLLHGE